ncbi:aspartate 1-decarboxylase [Clostridium botulinum]|uniref:aspartate 1-decarboxylase n=1 Tax=Clostridium botulinum TaxID=1491 RepID=UPI0007743E9B|nr:aspartate 1-decarboxylase [Clostridium botulinum]NFE94566.1 aspartate 1-decarboxylase [Clostridium botulinum]NFL39101.1 aspartate 1-decarboxylase [Clostridium botulinum]NFL66424.1 aspartate 1-decarboxylase [Clostridium botulinum]NFN08381.1 aspartate 1-decarboxylase [Clostridium botulinum]NFN24853.1 aspartate 1-decarboxylase [Clostridium botulinum]
MILNMLKGKIHRATVTQADLNYMGSITIDKTLIDAAGILENKKVQIVDNNNGARLETYVIPGKRDSGIICLNGAAARLVQPGDEIIIIAYAQIIESEAKTYKPKVVFVNDDNTIKEITNYEFNE